MLFFVCVCVKTLVSFTFMESDPAEAIIIKSLWCPHYLRAVLQPRMEELFAAAKSETIAANKDLVSSILCCFLLSVWWMCNNKRHPQIMGDTVSCHVSRRLNFRFSFFIQDVRITLFLKPTNKLVGEALSGTAVLTIVV